MADLFITELDAITDFDDTDLVVIEKNPGGTPETNKMTIADFVTKYLVRNNYQISRTVASNNLTVAIKDSDGNNATAAKPLNFNINGTIRKLSGALSVAVNAGVNTFNLGATEFATIVQEVFVYVGWRASDSSVFVLLHRRPDYREYAGISATATSENYGAYSGSAPAATDKVAVIGRVNVTNSGTASYNWSVPAADIIIQRPIYETSWLTWAPAYSASGSLTYTSVTTTFARYKIGMAECRLRMQATGTLGGTASSSIYATVPFESAQSANSDITGACQTATVAGRFYITAGTPDKLSFEKYDASNYATSGTNVIKGMGFYEI